MQLNDLNDDNTEEFSTNALRKTFPGKTNSEFEYSGRCAYCKVENEFSDISDVKIVKNSIGDILLYHHGCYERYLRRTID